MFSEGLFKTPRRYILAAVVHHHQYPVSSPKGASSARIPQGDKTVKAAEERTKERDR